MRSGKMVRRARELLDMAEKNGLCAWGSVRGESEVLLRMERAGEVTAPYPGLYARPQFWKELGRRAQAMAVLRSLALLHPDWVFCSFSAALVYGLYLSHRSLDYVHVCTTRRAHSRSSQWLCRHRVNRPVEVVVVDGVRVTSLPQTVLDCTVRAPLPECLGIVDSALRYYELDQEFLYRQVRGLGTKRWGIGGALRAVLLGDARSENGGESYLRGLIIDAGYAPPSDLQVEFDDPLEPGQRLRVDYLWRMPGGKIVIGELDGMEYYLDERMLHERSVVRTLVDERQRESHLTALGCPVMRFEYRRLGEDGYVVARLRAFGIPRADC